MQAVKISLDFNFVLAILSGTYYLWILISWIHLKFLYGTHVLYSMYTCNCKQLVWCNVYKFKCNTEHHCNIIWIL